MDSDARSRLETLARLERSTTPCSAGRCRTGRGAPSTRRRVERAARVPRRRRARVRRHRPRRPTSTRARRGRARRSCGRRWSAPRCSPRSPSRSTSGTCAAARARARTVSGGRAKPSILADAMEAVIAAVYLDGGLEHRRPSRARVCSQSGSPSAATGPGGGDYKTRLQELAARRFDRCRATRCATRALTTQAVLRDGAARRRGPTATARVVRRRRPSRPRRRLHGQRLTREPKRRCGSGASGEPDA